MPVPLEVMDLNQLAVLWAQNGIDGYGEWKVQPTGIGISVRWIATNRISQDAKGNPILIDAQVIVAQAVDLGSVMWLGDIDDLTGTGNFSSPGSGLHQVVSYRWAKDLKGINMRRELSLTRIGNRLPIG